MDDIRKYWIGFNLVKGIGAVRLKALLAHFGDARAAWQAAPSALRSAGLSKGVVSRLVQVRAQVDLDALWETITRGEVSVLTWLDPTYPALLREIDQPPPVLYVDGTLNEEDQWAVAVVGTRRMTSYGRQVTEELVGYLARNGITVVSGLARGVDTAAHRAALQTGGRTLAVLGSGVNRIYPPENRRLAAEIKKRGAILSDYPLGTPPEAANFPPRNRIISGLSMAVVVVEAGSKSGAAITATFAANQGRDVFAVPGSIFSSQSLGTNRLIQQGAMPMLDPQDVLEALQPTRVAEQRSARRIIPGDEVEAKLLKLIGTEPVHIDEISVQAALPMEKVSATMAVMELKGFVRQVGGMRYVVLR